MAPQALGAMKRGPMPLPPRGLRSPQFHGMLGHRPQQQIYPWMGALLRPGETVVGASLMGESLMRRAVQRITAPMTYCEVGLWRVPIAALGPDFVQIISNSSDEAYEYFRRSAGQVLGVPDSTDPVGSGGHLSFGLGTDHRAWAGEVGYADADAQGPSSPYARYISEGTYLIGSTWYDLDWFNMAALGSSADLMDSPPSVGPFIRGAGEMALASGLAGVGDVGTRIGDIIEHISLISRPDKSWAETLLDMGTPLSRIGSIPEPLMIKQQLLRSLGSTQYANAGNRRYTGAGFDDYDPEIGSAGSTDDTHSVVLAASNGTDADEWWHTSDAGGVQPLGTVWDSFSRRDRRIYAPSVLIGTAVWWPVAYESEHQAHRIDATLATSAGHWGVTPELDEGDFIRVAELRNASGTDIVPDETGSTEATFTVNMLNHYLHGDTFNFPVINAPDGAALAPNYQEFAYRGHFGQLHGAANSSLNHKLSARLHVLSNIARM